MTVHGKMKAQIYSVSPVALDGGELSDLRSGHFNPRGKFPGWASEAVLMLCGREKYLASAGNRTTIPRLSVL